MNIKVNIKITDDEVNAIGPYKDTCTIRTNNDSTITLDRNTLNRMIACMDKDKCIYKHYCFNINCPCSLMENKEYDKETMKNFQKEVLIKAEE